MRFKRILCFFNRHSPVRHRVEVDGTRYVGHCRRCGARIYRREHKDWRKRGPSVSNEHAH